MNAGKKAVVTGGTHGMGPAIVEALLAEGVEVVLTGRNEDNLAQARACLAGRPAHVVRSDAAVAADIDALGALVEQRLGRVDALFGNHGTAEFQTLDAATEESFDRQFAINTKGAFFTVQRLAPLVADGGSTFTTGVELPVDGGWGQGLGGPALAEEAAA
ncbi:SDR family NAD(P)-dependent oxidoreductase [Nocardia sp. Marseille-Q1738]